MGAGKGQTRRAQTTTTPTKIGKVLCHMDKWEKFVEEGGLKNMNLYQYYLNETPFDPTAEEEARVATELLADAVSIGAIVLPTPFTPENFTFHLDSGNKMRVALKGNNGYTILSADINNYFWRLHPGTKMGHTTALIPRKIANGIAKLLK